MKKISSSKALEIAYDNLYNSKTNQIDRNLDFFIKAKKYYVKGNKISKKQK